MSTLVSQFRASINPARFFQVAGITPDAWQQRLLTSHALRILVNISRQAGKSTTAAALGLHTAIYEPGSLVLLVSPTQRQSGELFKKALALYRSLGRPVSPESETALQLQLENGSRIVALPGKEGTIRGYSGVRLLVVDEAARVEQETYMAVLPMLAVSQGRIITLSTPFFTRGWWYESYRDYEADHSTWEYYEVPATECPRITPETLEEARRNMGEWYFQREFMCKFLDNQQAVFRRDDIERIFKKGIEIWDL